MPLLERIFEMIVYIRIFGEEPFSPNSESATLGAYAQILEQQCSRLFAKVGDMAGEEGWSTAQALIDWLNLPFAAEPLPPSLLPLIFGLSEFEVRDSTSSNKKR